mgnify:CR=1 FL=1
MSSLKGQLSNVEGSVKSMKAAVVVGSVLTVACLAAVFGVTILANEVSKEVKVSNNTLTTKSGKSVLTTSKVVTKKIELGAVSVMSEDFVAKVNAQTFGHVHADENTTGIIIEPFSFNHLFVKIGHSFLRFWVNPDGCGKARS